MAKFPPNCDLSSLDGSNGFQISGEALGDQRGVSVSSAGDVNGDGFDDVIVGAPNANTHVDSSGASYVVFGLPQDAYLDPILALGNFGTAQGWTSQDQYPRLLGDVNGDGRDDIVGFGLGGAYTALGQADGRFATPILSVVSFGFDSGAGGWFSQDQYPRLLGDTNGDGLADIIGFAATGVYAAPSLGDGTFGSPTLAVQNFGSDSTAGGWTTN